MLCHRKCLILNSLVSSSLHFGWHLPSETKLKTWQNNTPTHMEHALMVARTENPCEHLTWCHHQSRRRLYRGAATCWATLRGFSPRQRWAVRWPERDWCAGHWPRQRAAFYLRTRGRHLNMGKQRHESNLKKKEGKRRKIQLWFTQGCRIFRLTSPCRPLGSSMVFTSSSAISNAFNPLNFLSQNSWNVEKNKTKQKY